ncbi:MAG: helix-turn-helix transcriptional regulator [Cyclobacteriaceae bacterium]
MVCPRCIDTVREIFRDIEVPVKSVQLGEVVTVDAISESQKSNLEEKLFARGFELLKDQKTQLIAQIKAIVIKHVHFPEEYSTTNFSIVLSEQLNHDYSWLSKLFSSVEGITIEKYIVKQRIERAKELIFYNEFNLSEIAYKLGYSNVGHLSSQFKKETGMTPSAFKGLKNPGRKPLDKI